VSAAALGLSVPRNALLSTGTRDAVVETTQVAAAVGLAASSLAQDLLELAAAGAATVPPGFTSGSSLMPHKRNPDALELARGKGKGLQGHAVAASSIVAGLGLGYHRDFQLTKPILVAAIADAASTLEVLEAVVRGTTFDAEVLRDGFDAPGITATDVAEALVRHGVPFRVAYTAVARAYALVEHGEAFATALAASELPAEAVTAALLATRPDPTRRGTPGGPSPLQVHASLGRFDAAAAASQARLTSAAADVARASSLLERDPLTLVQSVLTEGI